MIKILVWCPVNGDATSYYRGWGPLLHIQKEFPDKYKFIAAQHFPSLDWSVLNAVDAVFLQRPATLAAVELIRMAHRLGKPVWIDYDDNYLAIPETSPRKHLYGEHATTCVHRCLELADIISVSTMELFNQYAKALNHVDKATFWYLRNALDTERFALKSRKFDGSKNKTILWRGGDTHGDNFQPYLHKIGLLYYNHPETNWVFVGHAPAEVLARIDNERVKRFDWNNDIFAYFDLLQEIKPDITIVPWVNNDFENCRSNNSWLESTMAGAVTVFPEWSTEFVPNSMVGYKNAEDFYERMTNLLADDDASVLTEKLENSVAMINEKYSLISQNELRMRLLNVLVEVRPTADVPSYSKLSYLIEQQQTQDYPEYRKLIAQTGDYLIQTIKPVSTVVFGCLTGALVEHMLDSKVPQCLGIDDDAECLEYFLVRNPHYQHAVKCVTDLEPIHGIFDLGVALDYFHKIPMDELEDYFQEIISKHFRWIYFSSTPFHTNKAFDEHHGNVNIRTTEFWITWFGRREWVLVDRPGKYSSWDLLFKNTRRL